MAAPCRSALWQCHLTSPFGHDELFDREQKWPDPTGVKIYDWMATEGVHDEPPVRGARPAE